MKKILAAVLACMMLFSLAACGRNSDSNESNASSQSNKAPNGSNERPKSIATGDTSTAQSEKALENRNETSETSSVSENNPVNEHNTSQRYSTKEMITVKKINTMNIKVGNKTFIATLEDNDTTKVLVKQLPLTVDMSELNGNEKYNYLSSNLSSDKPYCPGRINEGDLMLYGNNCLVLFYKTFNTSYSYVKLGHIDDTTGLTEAIGSGSVKVTFSASE